MKRKIAVGDPSAKRASFTRFVLPFAWQAQDAKTTSPTFPRFRRANKNDWIHSAIDIDAVVDEGRCRYFTPETADLLYHRASWFILEEEPNAASPAIWKKFVVQSGLKGQNHPYQVALRLPTVILFEDNPFAFKCGKNVDPDLLRTGFLVIEAFFPDGAFAPSFENLLRFNEIFRYWRCPYEKHATDCGAELNSMYEGIFGFALEEKEKNNRQKLYTDRWLALLRHPILIQGGQGQAVSARPLEWLAEDDGSGKNRQRNGDPLWLVHPDDRTFTMACAFLDGETSSPDACLPMEKTAPWAETVAAAFEDAGSAPPQLAGHWVKLLNIDRPSLPDDDGSCSRFEYRWARKRTYQRWAHYGTLYGFTPHSMALMAGGKVEKPDDDPHGDPPFALHCGRLYFDATLLLLYLRVSLFRFSKRLHELSADARNAKAAQEFPKWQPQFENIRWSFLLFENLYQFPLLSTQQQHIEMYELQRRCMDIRDLYEEIDKEVQSSDQVMDNKLDQQRNELASVLNTVAFIGLIGSLAIGWMQVHSDKGQTGPVWFLGLSLVFLIVFVGALLMSKKATQWMRLIAFPLRKQSQQNRASKPCHFKLVTDKPALLVVGVSILLGAFIWFFSPWIRPYLSKCYDDVRERRNKFFNIPNVTPPTPSHATPSTVPPDK